MTYEISNLPLSIQERYDSVNRLDGLTCKPGNKPCGKICIPQTEKCAIAGEKAPNKNRAGNNLGKVAAFGVAGVVGGVAGYAALKAGKEALEKRRQAKLEEDKGEEEKPVAPKRSGPDIEVNAPDEKMKSAKPKQEKKKKGAKAGNSSPDQEPEEAKKQNASPVKNAGILSRLNPFKKKEGVPTSTSAQTGKQRLLDNKKNALDKESRRKKIYDNIDNSIGARVSRKGAK